MAVLETNFLVILGPTAGGKSDVALEFARRTGADLLSVDSMQVYRHMNIGTAKPTSQEQAEVRHHLIDVVDPSEEFTVAKFVEQADDVIRRAAQQHKPLVATGGTPLYYKAMFDGLFEGPGADEALRERLRQQPNTDLHRRLTEVDPPAALRIHVNDQKRLIRALEVFELTGKPISSFQTDWDGASPRRHDAVWIGLHWETDAINRRINARVRLMIEAGWVDEVRRLLDTHGPLSQTAAGATGYAELIAHIKGQMSLSDAIEQIKISTRQLARRQMKWFRRFPNVNWIPGDAPLDNKLELISKMN